VGANISRDQRSLFERTLGVQVQSIANIHNEMVEGPFARLMGIVAWAITNVVLDD
jgi:hypothetical protein